MAIRPDRIDLFQDRGTLEERLMRFTEAEATYRKVWELSYRDSMWLEKVASLQARQGKQQAVVATLRQAWLEGRPARPELLMRVAEDLESWGMLAQAIPFARQSGARDNAAYARILTRDRDYAALLTGDDRGAFFAVAQAVDRYYTPEEKVAFAAALEKSIPAAKRQQFMYAVHAAGLYDLEARWLLEEMQAPRPQSYYNGDYQLKQTRGRSHALRGVRPRHGDAGRLGHYRCARRRHLNEAMQAYRAIGDFENQQRLSVKAAGPGGSCRFWRGAIRSCCWSGRRGAPTPWT